MKRIFIFGFFILLASCVSVQAKNHHVSVQASKTGAGTIDNPACLQDILFSPSTYSVSPGDTIYVHEGVYIGTFESKLVGTKENYITVMPYNNERVIIKREGIEDNNYILLIKGSYTTFRDFVVTSDIYNRTTKYELSPRTDVVTEIGINLNGKYNKLINCVIYNITGNGLNAASGAVENEIYGNTIFYQGYNETSREGERIFGHGHGMYLSNDIGRKLIQENIIFKGYGHGIQFYTEGTGTSKLTGSDFLSNISFNAGSLNDAGPNTYYGIGEYWNRNYIMGGNESTSDLVFSGNYSYMPAGLKDGTGVQIGYNVVNANGVVEDNYLAGGSKVFYVRNYENIKGSSNTIIGRDGEQILAFEYPEDGGPFQYSWDNNEYFMDKPAFQFGVHSYEAWQGKHQVDANSKIHSLSERPNHIMVFPNKYEEKRANIVVYNWKNEATVQVDLSDVLSNGDPYYIYDVEDLRQPIQEGIYSGSLHISTDQSSVFPLAGTNLIAGQVKHTPKEFGTYLLMPRLLEISDKPACQIKLTGISPQTTRKEIKVDYVVEGSCTQVDAYLFNSQRDTIYAEKNVKAGFLWNMHEICSDCGSGTYRIELVQAKNKIETEFTYDVPDCLKLTLLNYLPEEVDDILNVELCVSDNVISVDVMIKDEAGKQVSEESYEVQRGKNQLKINLKEFPDGVYVLEFSDKKDRVDCQVSKKAINPLRIIKNSFDQLSGEAIVNFYCPVDKTISVNVYDAENNLCHQVEFLAQMGESNEVKLDLSDFENGAYFIEFQSNLRKVSCEVLVNKLATGIEKIGRDEILIYPNPTKGPLSVKFNGIRVNAIKIYNMLGVCIYSEENSALNHFIDISDYKRGLYLLHFESEGEAFSYKIVKN